MTLIFKKDGDMFQGGHDLLVCTTNCLGVMGKGIALEFKNRFPKFFEQYKEYCSTCNPKGGDCMVFRNKDTSSPNYFATIMTKEHWFNKSKLEWIELGLEDLKDRVEVINDSPERLKITSIGLPAPGCNNGGLKWEDVKPLIDKHLKYVNSDIIVYEPREENASNT